MEVDKDEVLRLYIFLGGGVFNGVLWRNPNNDIKAFCVGRMHCSSHFSRILQKNFLTRELHVQRDWLVSVFRF